MNDIGGNSCNNGGMGSDMSSGSFDSKFCRDFIRNVCHRGKSCKFTHPENLKIRNDPIFCHDFQQNRCHRPSCKFIHCSREVEDHFKKTGELPDNVWEIENGLGNGNRPTSSRSNDISGRNSKGPSRSNGSFHGMESYSPSQADVPVCKDYLKGVCNRPPGSCKYRHVASPNDGGRNSRSNGRSQSNGGLRRRCSDGLYESEPDMKKLRNDNVGYTFGMNAGDELNEDFYVGNNVGRGYSALPPAHAESHQIPTTSVQDARFPQFQQAAAFAVAGANRNGFGGNETSVAAFLHSPDTIKALEDENFMLKRRIEELKTSNEFLLAQNAQLRLNSSLSVSRNSVGVENVQVQPAVGVASVANGVVQTMVSLAQPMGITPSLSVAATPLSTISTLPTVSIPPVSISQALPVVSIATHQPQPQSVSVYPMVTTQGVLPQPPNLT